MPYASCHQRLSALDGDIGMFMRDELTTMPSRLREQPPQQLDIPPLEGRFGVVREERGGGSGVVCVCVPWLRGADPLLLAHSLVLLVSIP